MAREQGNGEELTHRGAIIIVLAVAAVCAFLLLAAMWLIEPA
jgi:hypothetical protein